MFSERVLGKVGILNTRTYMASKWAPKLASNVSIDCRDEGWATTSRQYFSGLVARAGFQ